VLHRECPEHYVLNARKTEIPRQVYSTSAVGCSAALPDLFSGRLEGFFRNDFPPGRWCYVPPHGDLHPSTLKMKPNPTTFLPVDGAQFLPTATSTLPVDGAQFLPTATSTIRPSVLILRIPSPSILLREYRISFLDNSGPDRNTQILIITPHSHTGCIKRYRFGAGFARQQWAPGLLWRVLYSRGLSLLENPRCGPC
jgi:hypothetical protein